MTMSTKTALLTTRQLCFFAHYPPFVKAAELVRLARARQEQRALAGGAADADDIELMREVLLVGTHGAPVEVEQFDELLFLLEGERDSVTGAVAQCAVDVVRSLVLANERLLATRALMTYLVDAGAGVWYCDGRCAWPDDWAIEDNRPRRAELDAHGEWAEYREVADWRFDMRFAREQIGALERAKFVELALGLAPLALPVLLVLAVAEWSLWCDLCGTPGGDSDDRALRTFALPEARRWRIAALVQHF